MLCGEALCAAKALDHDLSRRRKLSGEQRDAHSTFSQDTQHLKARVEEIAGFDWGLVWHRRMDRWGELVGWSFAERRAKLSSSWFLC